MHLARPELPSAIELLALALRGYTKVTTYGGSDAPFVVCVDELELDAASRDLSVRRMLLPHAPLVRVVFPATFSSEAAATERAPA